MWDFILFVLFSAYIIYNVLQVVKTMRGTRREKPIVLFFFACFIDLFYWVRSKF